MEERQYEWQGPHCQEIAQQMQQQLCDCMVYGEDISTIYIDNEWHVRFGPSNTQLYQRRGYSLQVNMHKIQNVISFCCVANAERLVAYAITKEEEMFPLFIIKGDIKKATVWHELVLFGGIIAEPNKIVKTKEK